MLDAATAGDVMRYMNCPPVDKEELANVGASGERVHDMDHDAVLTLRRAHARRPFYHRVHSWYVPITFRLSFE